MEQKKQKATDDPDYARSSVIDSVMGAIDGTSISFTGENSHLALTTHSGYFHCDEALALAMLMVLPQFKGRPIVRTREKDILEKAFMLVDVGGEHDPARLRFDHHQIGFTETFNPDKKIKLSAAGLIYKEYGRQIISQIVTLHGTRPIREQDIDTLYRKCYGGFIEHIDGVDNGVNQFDGGNKMYEITTSLAARISQLNPEWNRQGVDENERFRMAMKLAGKEFIECVCMKAFEWLPARSMVEDAFVDRFNVHPSGSIVLLRERCPYQGHLCDLEKEHDTEVLYGISQDRSGNWCVTAMREKNGGFASRKAFPESWRGLRDEALAAAIFDSGSLVPDAVFTHINGFIGVAKSMEGAIKMAIAATEC